MSEMNGETNASGEQSEGTGQEELSNALAGAETEFVIAEEKKATNTGLLLLLLLVVAGGGGVFMLYKRGGPAPAEAGANVEAAKADATISTFLNNGPNGIKMMEQMLKDTEKVVKQFIEYPATNQIPLSDLKTNPFRFAAAKAANPNADADAAKKKREEEKLAALKAVQGMNLQSIIHSGSRKACMINNTMYMEGQQVDQFTIEKITPTGVVVKVGVYRFELKMQK